MSQPTKEQYNYALVMVDVYESEINTMQNAIKEHQRTIDEYESENEDE